MRKTTITLVSLFTRFFSAKLHNSLLVPFISLRQHFNEVGRICLNKQNQPKIIPTITDGLANCGTYTFNTGSNDCGTVVECTPHDQEGVGLKPTS